MIVSHKFNKTKNQLTVIYQLADKPYVSNSESRKAEREGREPIPKLVGSTGGFHWLNDVQIDDKNVGVSTNVIIGSR